MTRWRSAKRPPPMASDVVLVYMPHDGLTLVGWYDRDGQWYVYDQGWTRAVTHWQPLPKPPRVKR